MTQSPWRAAAATAALLCVAALPVAPGSAQEPSRPGGIVGTPGVVHGVEFLEPSLEYYRDVLGFDVISVLAEKPIFDIRVQTLTNHGGALYRSALLRIPDSALTLQLFEVTNGGPNSRTSPRQRTAQPTDRGSAVLGFQVPSIDGTFAAIANAKQATVISAGGKPAGGMLVVRNSDGFVTRMTQSGAAGRPATSPDPASITITPGDATATLRFYRDLLGFDLKTGAWEADDDTMRALGIESGMVRRSEGVIPGTDIHLAINEYRGIAQKRAYYYYNSMPGAFSLQLVVRELDEIVKTLRGAQVRIVTTGQQPVTLDRSRSLLIRDPDGIFVQLIEREQD